MGADLFVNATGWVFDMEEDLYNPCNVILVDQFSIKTTDGFSISAVAGSDSEPGYVEGSADQARFWNIYGITQWTSSLLVVADSANHCLRFVDRVSRRTSRFVGSCGAFGFVDGTGANALFNFPYSLLVLKSSFMLVSDNFNNAIRLVDFDTSAVSTLVRDISSPKDMVMANCGQQFYISTSHSIALDNLRSGTFTIITSTKAGFQDGSLSTAKFLWPAGLGWLDNDTLAVADVESSKVRLISLSQSEVTSICPTVIERMEGSSSSDCPIYYSMSVLRLRDALYIGGEGSINFVDLNVGSPDDSSGSLEGSSGGGDGGEGSGSGGSGSGGSGSGERGRSDG